MTAVPGAELPGQALEDGAHRRVVLSAVAASGAVLAAAALGFHTIPLLAGLTFLAVIVAWSRYLLAWPTLVAYVILILLFLPIRRFTMGGGLPFTLEPYRLLVALVLGAWLLAILADPVVKWRKTGFEGPIIAFVVVAVASDAVNAGAIVGSGLTGAVLKQASIFASFLLVTMFVTSTITTRRQLDTMVKVLVVGGTLVAIAALVEWRTSSNLFNRLQVIPLLQIDPQAVLASDARGGRVRAYASAEHPIALGALLVLLLPQAVYLYRRSRQPLWMGAAALLTFGALATGSRTAALMLAVLLVAFFWMKRKETVRLLPMLLPLFVACQVLMPGTLGTFKAIIFPEGSSVIAEQSGGSGAGEGRVADLGPTLQEWWRRPFLGQGFGTRVSGQSNPAQNSRILDNQWLGVLLEIGILGFLALIWLYVRAVRLLVRRSRNDATPYGWLLATFGAGLTAYAVGMLTFDAFAFIQVTFLSFVLLGLAGAALRLGPPAPA